MSCQGRRAAPSHWRVPLGGGEWTAAVMSLSSNSHWRVPFGRGEWRERGGRFILVACGLALATGAPPWGTASSASVGGHYNRAMEPLLPAFRRDLRARAHHLHPVVSIGHHGLTAPVLHEIDVALTAHELIKVRTSSDSRDERDALLDGICDALDCGAVQQIGKLLVLWRPRPAGIAATPKPIHARKGGHAGKTKGAEPRSPARPPAGQMRRRRAGASAAAAPAVEARRKGPLGKAPPGVPRAALPRRRRPAT
jgi:RNA-binding protein